MLKKWEELPENMRTPAVRPYWERLNRKRGQLALKRAFDVCMGCAVLAGTAVPMAVIAAAVKLDSRGPVFYRQERVTAYGRIFRIHKFRTMVTNADKIGAAVTVGDDPRITRVGKKLRALRLDELPQVFDVLKGDMSFVGTRPEAVQYVRAYRPAYYATLLLPAGITSDASIRYKDEESRLLDGAADPDKVYLEQVLPGKMRWNLRSLRKFSLMNDLSVMLRTVGAVLERE
ncbi:MAG: sugar transferase [Oscillospiraceae bacterium]|nr:sugar transferase [Oscillospiraceae bacterium]